MIVNNKNYIERDLKSKFIKLSNTYKIIAIIGARQSGKTTFLKEKIGSSEIGYISFDDPDIRQMFEEDVKKFENQYLKKLTILDEVHYCKDAGLKLKYLADKGYKLWLTSSSEAILSKDVLSYLVGRVTILKMYPFSLKEFLESRNQKEINSNILKRFILEHAVYGGYPAVVLNSDLEIKKTILGDLYQTMILKDIARTFSINDLDSLEKFVQYLSFNIGKMISYENLSSNLNLSFQTIKKYLDAMKKSYLIHEVKPFYKNKSKELTKQPKIYFVDLGLRNFIQRDFPRVLDGEVFENYVLTEFLKMNLEPKYWRTKSKAEVDFVLEKSSKQIIPIEVKLNPRNINSGLRNFIENYSPKIAFIVNYEGINKIEKVGICKVIFTDIFQLPKHLGKL
ncbi:MAG: ATP-binding protein [Nanoarchaeota archaeon]